MLRHGGLGETHLCFGESEFSSARFGGGETGHSALADQIPFELGQGGEDAKHMRPDAVVVSI